MVMDAAPEQQLLPIENNIENNEPPRFKLKSYHLFILVGILASFGGAALIVNHQAARPQPDAPRANYAADKLITDIDARLHYLQSRTSNVGFFIYTVKMKDNLWKIATHKHYSVHSIIGCNPQFETYDITYKQRLLVPSKAGTLHVVQADDSWKKIEDRYKVPVTELARYNPGLPSITKGDMVFVPDRRPDMSLMNDKMRGKYELRALFVSPLGGRISSPFGMRWHPVTGTLSMHGGLDIAVKTGTWVGAAADGVVITASNDVGHYGTAVFIDHQNGYITHYGHLSKIYVHVGQHVKAHQLIAKSGATGRVTGPHLHFTIKKNGVNLDPLKFIW
jgi:hypothetical protein